MYVKPGIWQTRTLDLKMVHNTFYKSFGIKVHVITAVEHSDPSSFVNSQQCQLMKKFGNNIHIQTYNIQDLKNVKGCRDGMPKSMQTR